MRRQGPSYSDGEQAVDQPGDQACFIPTDTVHRQGFCQYACGKAVTGPSYSDFVEDYGSPAGEVRRYSCGCACDHANQPGDQAGRVPADLLHRQGCRCACGNAATGPLSFRLCWRPGKSPQVQLMSVCTNRSLTCECLKKINESVEPGSRDSARLWRCNDKFLSFKLWQRREVSRRSTRRPTKIVDLPAVVQRNGPLYSDFVAWFVGRVVEALVFMADAPVVLCASAEEPIVPQFSGRKLLRRHSSFHKNAFLSSLSRWMMSTRFRDGGREA